MLDIQHNDLKQIPHCLLELPNLTELDLSHNQLTEIPDVPEWSSVLSVLNLSHNRLSTLPLNSVASSLHNLNLSHNHIRNVPLCICGFSSLHTLDLSDNPHIHSLPAKMGRLSNLTCLHLRHLKNLNDPPKYVQQDTRDCVRYLNSKLHPVKAFYHLSIDYANYRSVSDFINQLPDQKTLESFLSNRKGALGYTLLHEVAVSGHYKTLDLLLHKAGSELANCRANRGYTPLHLAARKGNVQCVRVLLRHNADMSATDEYGKLPRQTAESSSKSDVVRILCSAGKPI